MTFQEDQDKRAEVDALYQAVYEIDSVLAGVFANAIMHLSMKYRQVDVTVILDFFIDQLTKTLSRLEANVDLNAITDDLSWDLMLFQNNLIRLNNGQYLGNDGSVIIPDSHS